MKQERKLVTAMVRKSNSEHCSVLLFRRSNASVAGRRGSSCNLFRYPVERSPSSNRASRGRRWREYTAAS